MPQHPKPITRRGFLRLTALGALSLALPRTVLADRDDYESFDPPPRDYGRVIAWQQAVRSLPDPGAKIVAYAGRDEVIPLQAQLPGVAPWPSNPTWYMTGGGFVHSGYVQPVETTPNLEVIERVEPPGFWAEVCLPFAATRWSVEGTGTGRKLYYETVYRVVNAAQAQDGAWYYQLEQGITYNTPGLWVPASAMRRLSPEDLAPISPGRPDKRMEISITNETLTCFEGETPVFTTRTASGIYGLGTPFGEFTVLHKRFGWRMVGDDYDLPGVPFPVYITRSAVAIHGTYWHNDYGRRHSHGCLNVASRDARWIYRWVDPIANYADGTTKAEPGKGTPVTVVA
ncbi:MAG: L,D-transpeptidase [Anaerolineae bacterium]|jgi:hypothetical protein|nr:L,D-transpeptidase [Anaerolineae bacterium]